jgi:hypothetical protein
VLHHRDKSDAILHRSPKNSQSTRDGSLTTTTGKGRPSLGFSRKIAFVLMSLCLAVVDNSLRSFLFAQSLRRYVYKACRYPGFLTEWRTLPPESPVASRLEGLETARQGNGRRKTNPSSGQMGSCTPTQATWAMVAPWMSMEALEIQENGATRVSGRGRKERSAYRCENSRLYEFYLWKFGRTRATRGDQSPQTMCRQYRCEIRDEVFCCCKSPNDARSEAVEKSSRLCGWKRPSDGFQLRLVYFQSFAANNKSKILNFHSAERAILQFKRDSRISQQLQNLTKIEELFLKTRRVYDDVIKIGNGALKSDRLQNNIDSSLKSSRGSN